MATTASPELVALQQGIAEQLTLVTDIAASDPTNAVKAGMVKTLDAILVEVTALMNPPVATPPPPPPGSPVLTVKASGTTAVVSWPSTFVPISIGRDGTDSSGTGPWTTPKGTVFVGTSFTFSLLAAGKTYNFTATDKSGATAKGSITIAGN